MSTTEWIAREKKVENEKVFFLIIFFGVQKPKKIKLFSKMRSLFVFFSTWGLQPTLFDFSRQIDSNRYVSFHSWTAIRIVRTHLLYYDYSSSKQSSTLHFVVVVVAVEVSVCCVFGRLRQKNKKNQQRVTCACIYYKLRYTKTEK